VVLLADDEALDNPLSRLHGSTAISHGLALGTREHLNWLVVVGGPVLRLYPVSPDVGVGRKGQTKTFVELDLSVLPEADAGYLSLLFSPTALVDAGTASTLLNDSLLFAAGLSERLRERVYKDVIPGLARAVAQSMHVADLPAVEQKNALAEAYHRAMIVLFRLLFVAYAEDRRLLPFEESEQYTRNALKTLARDMLSRPDQPFDEHATTLWDDLTQVWKVIDTGDLTDWGVPAYDGGLFTQDAAKNSSGAATYHLDLTNTQVGPVLKALLIDKTRDGTLGPVDFRSLSVREFGTIYEGLLESGLSITDIDLTVDEEETYVPAAPGDKVEVEAGQVYFHSISGSRKITGSYFTKAFAVEHLLNTALEPALDRHLGRVRDLAIAGATTSAAEALFDFRVADLSMGSAHFLVAAVDRIEARFSAFLAENPLPAVVVELDNLRAVAATQLAIDASESGIDDSTLLRRQIARRCIYGVDMNEIAVELARLGLWIHTFVPGLPLSFLNHGLVVGNSLTGIGTIKEIEEALSEAQVREFKQHSENQTSVLDQVLHDFLDRAAEYLAALSQLSDANVSDVTTAADTQARLEVALAPLAALCDLITGERATRQFGSVTTEETHFDKYGKNPKTRKVRKPHPDRVLLSASAALFTAGDTAELEAAILSHPHLGRAKAIADDVSARHFPVTFPEIFRRDRPGFDCVLGNPPWEKLQIEEHSFWAIVAPGLRAMSQDEAEALMEQLRSHRPDLVADYQAATLEHQRTLQILKNGPFPGLTTGRADLYKAFAWRFLQELRDLGTCGVVVPGKLIEASGNKEWRVNALNSVTFADVTVLLNDQRWVFDIHEQTTVLLLTLASGATSGVIVLRGPYRSMAEYVTGMEKGPLNLSVSGILGGTESAAIPLLPDPVESAVYLKMRTAGPLTAAIPGNTVRGLREFNAHDDSGKFHPETERRTDDWPVYTGVSFDLWNPDTGIYYAWISPGTAVEALLSRAANMRRTRRSAFYGQDKSIAIDISAHPAGRARIAWRDSTNRDNLRTILSCLVPPHVCMVHQAYYLFLAKPDPLAEAYLLGVLSSIPFDWFARRSIERHATVDFMNGAPVPVLNLAAPLHLRIAKIAGMLGAADNRFQTWADAVGAPVASVTSDGEKEALLRELDACVALAYGLFGEEVTTIYATFRRGWDYQAWLAAVLDYYRAWQQNEKGKSE
jgi:Eco57I restriction-modification methylase